MFSIVRKHLDEILEISEKCPENYRVKCFELLLDYLLNAVRNATLNPSGQQNTHIIDSSKGKKESLNEFIRRISPKSAADYVATIGYYLEKYENLDGFKTANISKSFKTIKYKHSNPAEAMKQAERTGWLMDGNSGNKILTKSGEEWVNNRLTEVKTNN